MVFLNETTTTLILGTAMSKIRGIPLGRFPLGPFCNQAASGSLCQFFRESLKSGVADLKGAENAVSGNVFWALAV